MEISEPSLLSLVGVRAWHTLRMHGVILLALGIVLRLVYNRYGSPLRKYPGPFLASCTRLWQGEISGDAISMAVLTAGHQYM